MLAGAVVLVAATVIVTTTVTRPAAPSTPGAGSVDVGFAQDMIEHHVQAVEIGELIRGRARSYDIAALASDIVLTHQAQIGRMQGWLALWEQPQAAVTPRQRWMGREIEGQMPGLASREQLRAFAEAAPADAERQFLELMLDHHVAAIEMAEFAAQRAEVADVRRLAEAIARGQRAEVEEMRRLLAWDGAPSRPI